MNDETVKQLAITRCMTILKYTPVKIFRFGDAYTVKDKTSGNTIFEIKSAEYCNAEKEEDTPCECLIVNKKKFSINQKDNKLLSIVQTMYDEQHLNNNEEQEEELPETLVFLDKYIYR